MGIGPIAEIVFDLSYTEDKMRARVYPPERAQISQDWSCSFEIDEPISVRRTIFGVSSVQALVLALKKYGAMVSDNSSSFFSISITPDDRWGNAFADIANAQIGITNFEVVQTTGPTGGPRSAGGPTANAGPDQAALLASGVPLPGVVNYSGNPPTILWKQYSGPGTVTFGNASQANTTVNFSAPGTYTLRLSADDGVHAVAYDAVVITVTSGIALGVSANGTNATFTWTGGSPPYVLQQSDSLPAISWDGVVTTSQNSASIALTTSNRFFRVQGTAP